jgi:hypothetical protein
VIVRTGVTHALALAALAAALALPTLVQAQERRPATRPPVGGVASPADAMIFYLARGPDGSCGKGCSEWIVAEGAVQWDTHKRLFAFLDRHPGLKRPVAIDTWGFHSLRTSISLGRILRERRLDTMVGMTYPQACARETEGACFTLKRAATEPMISQLYVTKTRCDLACIFMMAGGVHRTIPPGTRVLMHATEIYNRFGANVSPEHREGLTEFYSEQTRRYFAEMGIDPDIMDMMKRANASTRDIELPASEWPRLHLVTD